MGKVNHQKLCKKLKFDYMNKWYMPNPESILENDMLKILWNRSPNPSQMIKSNDSQQNKENQRNCWLCHPADHKVKLKEKEKRDKYVDLAREL